MKREPMVLAFALAFPTAMAYVYFIALSQPEAADPQANRLMQTTYTVSKIIQFGLPVVWLASVDRAALRWRWPGLRGVPTGIAFGLGVSALTFALYFGWLADAPLFRETPARLRTKLHEIGVVTPAGFVWLSGFLAIVHSLLEEYYWRWFVYGRLRRHVPMFTALSVAGLAFMAHHVLVIYVYFPGWLWAAVVPFSVAVALGGVVWAWLYERSGSLLGPWVSHLIVDVALMAVGYDIAFGTRHSG